MQSIYFYKPVILYTWCYTGICYKQCPDLRYAFLFYININIIKNL